MNKNDIILTKNQWETIKCSLLQCNSDNTALIRQLEKASNKRHFDLDEKKNSLAKQYNDLIYEVDHYVHMCDAWEEDNIPLDTVSGMLDDLEGTVQALNIDDHDYIEKLIEMKEAREKKKRSN